MEIGNILGKLKGSEKSEPKKFLALILTDEVVQAAVWHVSSGQTEIVATGTPVEWDGDTGTTTELITAVDATISSAVEGLTNEPDNVILGIPNSWVDKNGILGVKKEFISKIRNELELQPIGYVVITESVLSYLKIQEGTPTTSIIIQVSRDELTLALVRLGRIEAVENIGRSDDVVEDVIEGITRFKVADNLPSRIILFNSMHNLDEIIQNLMSVDWPAQFNFLHIPKIEALSKDVAIRALAVAGGSEVAKSLGIPVTKVIPPAEPSEETSSTEEVVEVEAMEAEEIDEIMTADEIGFTTPKMQNKPQKVDFIEPEDDIVQNSDVEVPEMKSSKPKMPNFTIPQFKIPKIQIPKFRMNLSKSKPHWWIIGGSLVLLGILIFYLGWVLPSAVVSVSVEPKVIDEAVELTLSSTESSINFSDRIVPANIESVSETGEKVMETTGKKTIGDPSKGQVTVYNKTSSPKTFNKGTVLTSGNLKYTLDGDVSIASSSSTTEGITFGKNTVAVTASAIGVEGNLPAGTEFTIQSFSKDSYVAKNDAALTGGTSEEVQVVGKEDQQTLVKALTEELIQSLSNKSLAESSPGTGVYLIPDSAKLDTVTYSAKIGEEAKSLTANLTIKASLLKYQSRDVETLVNSSIDQKVPTGYVRSDLPPTVELSATNEEGSEDSVKGSAKVKVSLLPVVDKTQLQTTIKGKSVSVLENILRTNIPGYVKAEVLILPKWTPTKLKTIPRNPSKITIEIKPAI